MVASPIGRWALWGNSPAGRFLVERRQVCAEFPLVAAGDARTVDWPSLLADTSLDGIVLTVPRAERAERICGALSAGKIVLVEGWPCLQESELARIEAARERSGREIGVFFTRPVDADFLAAQAAIRAGRLGVLQRVTWIGCEFALPSEDGDAAILDEAAAGLLRQFLELTGQSPDCVEAWTIADTLGIQLHLTCPSGLTASLEGHRRSLCGLRTGWVLEGSLGAYRQGRIMSLAADGELRDEPIAAPDGTEDVWQRLQRLAEDPAAAGTSWRLTADAIRLLRSAPR